MLHHRFLRFAWPIALGVLLVGAWRSFGWPGIALAAGAIVMWVLLHLSRTMWVLKRAADQPLGSVGSAVMLNARLKPGLPLLQVVGLARALGQPQSAEGAQPEVFAWRDPGDSVVTAEFAHGRLVRWKLDRPAEPAP
jgi:hypothetical protein